jgi:hypothetical protein
VPASRSSSVCRTSAALLGAVLLLACAAPAAATPLWFDSGDAVDCAAYTATGCDSLLWTTETNVASAEDGDLSLVKIADGLVQNGENGGDASSLFALKLNYTTNEASYYTTPRALALNQSTLTLGFRFYLSANPTAAKTIAMMVESDGGEGCNIRVGTDGKLSVYYEWPIGEATTFGTSAVAITPKACWAATDKTSVANCTAASGCASGYTCGNASSVCDAATGAGCYFAGLELTQENLTTPGGAGGYGKVRCTLRQNGRVIVAGEVVPVGKPNPITNVRVGNIVSSSGTFVASMDSFVLDDSTRAGHGFMAVSVPTAEGVTVSGSALWQEDTCGAGVATRFRCVDDLAAGVFAAGTGDYIHTSSAANKVQHLRFGALAAPSSGTALGGIGLTLLGRAASTNAATRTLISKPMLCEGTTTCAAPQFGGAVTTVVAADTTDRALTQIVTTTAPGGNAPWGASHVSRLGVQVASSPANDGQSRLAAALAVGFYGRPDAVAVSRLREGNAGTDDDRRTIAFVGHSNTGGTIGGTCEGGPTPGTACNQLDYASWDPLERDSPTGGCFGDHTVVRTCRLRKAEFNGSGGFPCGTCSVSGDCENGGTCALTCAGGTNDGTTCTTNGNCTGGGVCLGVCSTADAECPVTGGTCTGDSSNGDGIKEGACSQNTSIPCDGTADCNGLGGVCDSTATCVLSCGAGGSCAQPNGYAGIAAANITATTALVCSQGAEGTTELLNNRWTRILQGIEPSCQAIVGTGRWQCTVSGDCPGGGTCTSGLCVGGSGCRGFKAGDFAGKTCTVNADCGTAGTCLTLAQGNYCACQFDPPDVLYVHSGAADVVAAYDGPNCAEPQALVATWHGVCADACVPDAEADLCTTDAEARAAARTPPDGAPDARCLGVDMATAGQLCTGGPTCTAQIGNCHNSTDCPYGQTCTQSATTVQATLPVGLCECASDAQCPADHSCVGSRCRKQCGVCSGGTAPGSACGVSADCPGSGTCGSPSDAMCVTVGTASSVLKQCTGSTPYVCQGRANCPCSRTACTVDADCPVNTPTLKGRPWRLTGICTAGHCAQCGVVNGACEDAAYSHARGNWTTNLNPHHVLSDDFLAFQAVIDALGESDRRPLLLPLTEPTHTGTGCVQYTDPYYLGIGSQHLLTTLPRTIDARAELARYPSEQMYAECLNGVRGQVYGVERAVHYTGPAGRTNGCLAPTLISGAEVVSAVVLDYTDALNTCAVGRCRSSSLTYGPPCGSDADCTGMSGDSPRCEFKQGLVAPQKYCREPDRDFTATPCTSDATCTGGVNTCEVRPCTCVCTKTTECAAWYGSDYACKDASNGTCDAGEACACKAVSGNADACLEHGAGYACDAASAKCLNSGADACPATGDGCNPE